MFPTNKLLVNIVTFSPVKITGNNSDETFCSTKLLNRQREIVSPFSRTFLIVLMSSDGRSTRSRKRFLFIFSNSVWSRTEHFIFAILYLPTSSFCLIWQSFPFFKNQSANTAKHIYIWFMCIIIFQMLRFKIKFVNRRIFSSLNVCKHCTIHMYVCKMKVDYNRDIKWNIFVYIQKFKKLFNKIYLKIQIQYIFIWFQIKITFVNILRNY